MNLEEYKSKAKLKETEHKKFLDYLKKKKPKNLDIVAQEIHNEVFNEINCLQCANCCKTTGPLFTDKDIERITKKFRLKPSDFIEKYLQIDEDKDFVLRQLPCIFLDDENKCTIYEIRPKACKEFPHTDRKKLYQINNLTIKNLQICPATYEFMEKLKIRIL